MKQLTMFEDEDLYSPSSLLSPTIPYPNPATGNRLRHASGPVPRVDAKILVTKYLTSNIAPLP